MKRPFHKHNDGFSILEVVIVVGVFAILVVLMASTRSNVDLLENLVGQRLQSREDVDVALRSFVSEVRSAGPSSLGGYAIEAAGTSSFQFYSDIDGDGLFERVRYTIATSTLEKAVVKPSGNPLTYATSSEVVTTAVTNIIKTASTTFAYYDSAYTGTQAPLTMPINVTDIRLVQLNLMTDIHPSSSPKAIFVSETVAVRNLRSN